MAAACASCRLNQACNEIDGLIRGLNRVVQQEGEIPPHTGGVIGLARQQARTALAVLAEIRHNPHPRTADVPLAECHSALTQFMALSSHRVSGYEVPALAQATDEAAWASWRVSWAVYGGYP